ncbi:MAG: signal peptide peptidase SppA [Gammaproteobacteria bacterium]|nr:signal peptide peptidase SppA [Gammaproteobacteria bacterium]MBT8057100.1 signal peptide peptidase SppA [Gammaproteobacteria bacterium]NNJ79367.1 signal peptide peptidase SppA [Xanthomonadales bacterium]
MAKERSFVSRFFHGLWRFIDGTRKVVLNLVFLLILALVISAIVGSEDRLVLEPDTALVLRPYGDIVEQYSGTPLDYALMQATAAGRQETRLRDLVDAVRRAANDPRIVRLVIDPSFMRGAGMASLLEIGAAVEAFRASGKPVVALGGNLGQSQYLLASMADEIWLNPLGMVWLDGFAAYRQYYHEGLEKLEVEINLFRAGKFKSAMEPFIRDDMSPEAKEANLHWISDIWYQYLDAVSRHRAIPAEALAESIDRFADRLEAADGDFAQLALEAGLVDQLMSRPEAHLELARRGAPGEGSEGFRQVDQDAYLALQGLAPLPPGKNLVAVVVAEGEIVPGRQPQGVVGAVTLAEKLRKLGENHDVHAVVIRINSPGGDAFASEVIRREIQALRDSGKRVVVSMGNVAASGGYWIAMSADEVWASPSSITGSIGVYGVLPTFQKPLEKLGIHTDGVGTTELAGKMRLDLPLDPALRRIFQQAVERTYDNFIGLVAGARGMTAGEVAEVAQGRVWSGGQAQKNGLVDSTGTLQQSIDSAARLAGLGADYKVVYDEWDLSPIEQVLIEMVGSAAVHLELGFTVDPLLRNSLFARILDDLKFLAGDGDSLTVVAHCLCESQ